MLGILLRMIAAPAERLRESPQELERKVHANFMRLVQDDPRILALLAEPRGGIGKDNRTADGGRCEPDHDACRRHPKDTPA